MRDTITLKTSVETWGTGEEWLVTRYAATDEIVQAYPVGGVRAWYTIGESDDR